MVPRRLKAATVISTRRKPPGGLELGQRIADEIEIHAHALFDFLSRRRRQRVDFVGQARDGALRARDDASVADHQLPETLLRIANGSYGHDDFIVDPIEAEGDDFEEQRLFADEVMVESGLGHAEGACDVADRRGVKSPVAKEPGDLPADVCAAGVEAGGRLAPGGHRSVTVYLGPLTAVNRGRRMRRASRAIQKHVSREPGRKRVGGRTLFHRGTSAMLPADRPTDRSVVMTRVGSFRLL